MIDWTQVGAPGAPPFLNGWRSWPENPLRFRVTEAGRTELVGGAVNDALVLSPNGLKHDPAIFELPIEARPERDQDVRESNDGDTWWRHWFIEALTGAVRVRQGPLP